MIGAISFHALETVYFCQFPNAWPYGRPEELTVCLTSAYWVLATVPKAALEPFPMPAPTTTDAPVTVVSGLPRSGTSMMMKMLEAGGMKVLTDKIRTADEDNPKGYYEFERVKQIATDQAWLPEAQGKVVKIISFLLLKAPAGFHYKVIFMKRALPEVLASQQQMLIRRGDNSPQDDRRMSELYEKHLRQAFAWMEAQPNVDVLYVDHRRAVESPLDVATEVAAFLDTGMDPAVMAAEVDKGLHRQRA